MRHTTQPQKHSRKRLIDLPNNKSIQVGYLARVEGEASLVIDIERERVKKVELQIFEPPRFFEAFLRGRGFEEAPDITARICGICPVAYQMSSIHAIERAYGMSVDGQIRELRRLLYCGEWIESHCLHIFMLHAPDFMGYPSAIEMAGDHREIVDMGLRIKKAGNEIVKVVGGREIHPINVKVGGFYKAPSKEQLNSLLPELKTARDEMIESVKWAANLDFPDLEQNYTFVSLNHPNEYPFNEGKLVSNHGLSIDASEFEDHFVEEHVEYSNALHGLMRDGSNYLVGPLARFNNCFDQLPESVKNLALEIDFAPPITNPFKSIVVRGLEVLFSLEEAIRIIENYAPPELPSLALPDSPSTNDVTGWAITEAPRGSLYHSYMVDPKGLIKEAKIVPPTSQNQPRIENDLENFLVDRVSMEHERLTLECEQLVRSYDPCISCATHFLDVTVNRSDD